MDHDKNTVTPEKETGTRAEKTKQYNKIKLRLTISDIALNLAVLLVFAFSGISPLIAEFSRGMVQNDYARFLVFLFVLSVIFSLAGSPLEFYGSYVLEHRFGLSNQSFLQWAWEKVKSTAVGLVIGVPVALVFYSMLRFTGPLWWLYFSAFIFLISVVLARIAPVLIFPLFYTFTELDDGEVKRRIQSLLREQGIPIKGIFSFNMSKNTKKANAGFTGIGKSKRIILSDTLLEKFTPQEIAVIFAHELGHYKKRHILKNIVFSTVIIFVTFYVCSMAYGATLAAMGFSAIHELAALPVLLLYITTAGLVLMPLTNAVSRRYEVQADEYALVMTGDSRAFISSMDKLADINMADREPHPLNEFFFYSHPSIKKRIDFARKYQR